MLFKFFKGFQPANLILIIILTIVFWLKFFFDDANTGLYIDPNPLPLYGLIMNFFASIDFPFLNKFIALFLVLFQAILVAAINNHFKLLGYRSYLPALIFVLITINFSQFQMLHPVLFANLLFLIAWIQIKKAQGKQKALVNYFDASLLIGLASLFYFNIIYLVVILWVNTLISRPGSFKEISMSFVGPILIWYLFLSFYFIFYDYSYDVLNFFSFDPKFYDFTLMPTASKISALFFVLIILLASLALFRYYSSLNINIRKNLKLFLYLFILGILIILLTNSSLELIYLIAVPVSLFLSLFFINLKSRLLGNILIGLMFLVTILNLFLPTFSNLISS